MGHIQVRRNYNSTLKVVMQEVRARRAYLSHNLIQCNISPGRLELIVISLRGEYRLVYVPGIYAASRILMPLK